MKMKSVLTPKKTPNPNSLKNLRPPWRPGESGNPNGRPTKYISEAYEHLALEQVPGDRKKAVLYA
jgi:hypothetical protein